ncbi:uncharacterized protein LOC109255905 isoform X3 [Panthera pardus]|uniref:Uncharacterized protein LOC109255905 isoform X3 n=1 Tax=Panthera pardus TaxID=9691 RepID=A0A9W2V2S8_PANPR|nr:uncharacterized protein LOC109255905 isoform X3 [Panthera pardus]
MLISQGSGGRKFKIKATLPALDPLKGNRLQKPDDHSLAVFHRACSGSVDVFPVTSPAVFDLRPLTVKDSVSGHVPLLARYFNCVLFESPTEERQMTNRERAPASRTRAFVSITCGFPPVREDRNLSSRKASQPGHRQPQTVPGTLPLTDPPPLVEESGPRISLEETGASPCHLRDRDFRPADTCPLVVALHPSFLPVGTPLTLPGFTVRVGM